MCPRCGEEAVRVTIAKDTGKAVVLCAMCQLKDEFPAHPAAQAIDVYSYFTDKFYGVKDPRAIIPKDRAIPRFHAEEAEEEKAPEMPEPLMAEESALQPELGAKIASETTALSTQETQTAIVETPSTPEEPAAPVVEASELGQEESPASESQEDKEEEEPFADILENKDKKRYSSNPLPQESSQESSEANQSA